MAEAELVVVGSVPPGCMIATDRCRQVVLVIVLAAAGKQDAWVRHIEHLFSSMTVSEWAIQESLPRVIFSIEDCHAILFVRVMVFYHD